MIRHNPGERFGSISGIKRELIARGNSFVQQQKLDALKKQVVPSSTVTDPLVAEPPEPISVYYNGRALIFTLSKAPTREWVDVFRQITGVSYYPGQEPSSIGFSGNQATFMVTYDQQAQSLVPMFKEYVKAANRDYAHKVASDMRRREQEARENLRARIQAEERRQSVLRTLKL
jgi:hypothetical protein